MSSSTRARLLILIAALLFSTGGAAIKATALDSWQVAGFRSGLAALALWVLFPAWRRFWQPRTLLVGAAYAATLVLFVTSNKLTSAANAIFLQASAPIYVLMLAPRLLGERALRGDLARVGVMVVGLALFFVGSETPQSTAPDPVTGNGIAVLSGLAWGLTLLGLRRLGKHDQRHGTESAGAAAVAGNLIALGVCLPFALPVGPSAPVDWAVIAYLGLFQIALAYVCLTRGVREVRALEVSLLLLLEPVLNAVWAWAIHGELPGPWALLGCATILAGTAATALRPGGPDDAE